jgi:hypothetical protein
VKEDDEKNGEQHLKDSDEKVESPTPALEIAGTVEGEPDNNQLESQGGGDLQVNTEVGIGLFLLFIFLLHIFLL